MAGNDSWAERVREGVGDTDPPDGKRGLRLDGALPAGTGRHLYVAYSADTQRGRSTRPKMQAPLHPPPSDTTPRGMLDRSVQVQIGRMLRDVFADVADEPVPERFVRLLEALEVKEKHG